MENQQQCSDSEGAEADGMSSPPKSRTSSDKAAAEEEETLARSPSTKRELEVEVESDSHGEDDENSTKGKANALVKRPRFGKEGEDRNNELTLTTSKNESQELDYVPLRTMMNTLVMEQVADKLPARNLLNLRNTCTVWNSNFISQLKRKHSRISLNDRQLKCSSTSASNNVVNLDLDLANFIQIMRSSPNNPFTSFQFNSSSYRELERDSFMDFMGEFGSRIVSLQLNWREHDDLPLSQLKKVIFELTPELVELNLEFGSFGHGVSGPVIAKVLPNLRRLKLNFDENVYLDRHGNENGHPQVREPGSFIKLTSEVIQCAEQLEALDFAEDTLNNEFLRPVLTGLLHNPHIDKLTTLKACTLEPPDLQVLIQLAEPDGNAKALQLKAFSFVCYTDRGGAEGWSNEVDELLELIPVFLATQAKSLRNLGIAFDSGGSRAIPLRIPRMEHLSKFKVTIIHYPDSQQQFECMDGGSFMDNFPELTSFSYQCDYENFFGGYDQDADDFLENIFHSGVAKLKLKTCYRNFANLGSMFPSVTRLNLKLDRKSFSGSDIDVNEFASVWTTWSSLSELKIHLGKGLKLDLDSLLSGVPRGRLEGLKRKVELVDRSSLTLNSIRAMLASNKYKARQAVSDVENLRELVIMYEDADATGLTDLGVYFGLAFASPTIQRIVVHGREENCVSEDCFTLIKSVLHPFAVINL